MPVNSVDQYLTHCGKCKNPHFLCNCQQSIYSTGAISNQVPTSAAAFNAVADFSNYELLYLRDLLTADRNTVGETYRFNHISTTLITRINTAISIRAGGF